jgi:ABC-type multidrug transport system ATPase subunit
MSPAEPDRPTPPAKPGKPASAPAKPSAARPARPPRPERPAKPTAAKPTAAKPAAKAAPKPAPKPKLPPGALDAFAVTKTYGDLPALAPLDLRVMPGESVVLVGHNGSGKTTFLRMASGLLDPSEGTVDVAGHIAGSLGARAACSYLADNPTFYDDLSVWEHLEYVARLHGRSDWEQDAADLLGVLGLYHRADDLPVTFSRGLRQKTAIALGLIRPFDVLLVDEPFVGLDASGKAALLELFDEYRAKGTTLVVATHELEFVHRVSRCVALRDGSLVYDGPAEGIDVLELVS